MRAREPLPELGPPPSPGDVLHGDRHRSLLADEHHQPLAARHAGVEEVPLQHGVVLGHERDDHAWILGALALVDRRGVGGHQRVQLAEPVRDGAAVEVRQQLVHVG